MVNTCRISRKEYPTFVILVAIFSSYNEGKEGSEVGFVLKLQSVPQTLSTVGRLSSFRVRYGRFDCIGKQPARILHVLAG